MKTNFTKNLPRQILFFAGTFCSLFVYGQASFKQSLATSWGSYVRTSIAGYGNTLLQVTVDGQNSTWNGLFTLNGVNSWTPDVNWNNSKLISFSGYNADKDDVQALIMAATPTTQFGGTEIVIKLRQPTTGTATITVVATGGLYASNLSLSSATTPPLSFTMASSEGTFNIWAINNKVGIGTYEPKTLLDVGGELRLGSSMTFPVEGSILEGEWGNYIIGNVSTSQQLRLGVSNDLFTKAEILLDNANRPDGVIALKTSTGNTASIPRLVVNGEGKVGIGTTSPRSLLDIGSSLQGGKLGAIFGRLPEGDGSGEGTFLGVRGYGTQTSEYEGKSFALEHGFYGNVNSSINFHRGGSVTGGFITFNTFDNTERMRIAYNGNVYIGTTSPVNYKLAVNGSALFTRAVVKAYGNWPDYVFSDSYQLPSLTEVEAFIKANAHLPQVPSAKEVAEKGLDLGENQATLLKKIEELTLYIIQQQKTIDQFALQLKDMDELKEEIKLLKQRTSSNAAIPVADLRGNTKTKN